MVMAQVDFDAHLAKNSQVTFTKYGDRYFLEEVSIASSGAHVSVLESREEKGAAPRTGVARSRSDPSGARAGSREYPW